MNLLGQKICLPLFFAARINDHGRSQGYFIQLSEEEKELKWFALGKEGE